MNILEHFKRYIAEQYRELLDLTLLESSTSNNDTVIWIKDSDKTAWLLDAEVGLAFRIVLFSADQDALNTAIQESIRRATQLQPRYGIDGNMADEYGIWQVAICWLVEANLKIDWYHAIATIRKESGFSEEIGLDAIFFDEEELITACEKHGLPQLLLQTRRLLNLSWAEMPGWLSADAKVSEMLATFPDRFIGNTDTYQLAFQLVRDALQNESLKQKCDVMEPDVAVLQDIEVSNFRNIEHCHLRFPKTTNKNTQAHIIFGPNGTGKTSIFEALCLAVGGVSNTFADYLDDEDIKSRNPNYSTSVLSPLASGFASPKISLNGSEKTYGCLDKTQAQSDWRNLEGSFQAQEDSRKFLEAKGESLAQRILKGYSLLADEVLKLAETREQMARTEKSEWLKSHHLSSAITRRETRAQRLIEGELQKEAWQLPQSLVDWLETTVRFFPNLETEGQRLAVRWRSWQDKQSQCVEHMADGVLLSEASIVREVLSTRLIERNKLLVDTRVLVNQASTLIEPLRDQLHGVEKELDAWGEWSIRQNSQTNISSNEEQKQLGLKIEHMRKEIGDLRRKFAFERKRATHLKKLKDEFLTEWIREQPEICPTCGDNHPEGIDHVVDRIQNLVVAQLTEYEQQGKQLNATLAQMEAKITAFGVCPVNPQRQSELQALLRSFFTDVSLPTLLTDSSQRGMLKQRIQVAQRLPSVSEALEEIEAVAGQVAERCIALDAEAERLWPLPEHWATVVKALRGECDVIVEQHLPGTLQKLWWEITLALTSARWNLAATPVFQIKGQRNSQKLIIGVEQRPETPARYLFNQAERHIMGLAWFFTRYLTHGRFHRAFIALDDPAQEMDQTTFRSFARFVQSLLRLQASKKIPLDMVLFLHQEDRALDMTRATMGRFLMLPWRSKVTIETQGDDLREVKLLSPGFHPQNAVKMFVDESQKVINTV
jgi:hypothetical protein